MKDDAPNQPAHGLALGDFTPAADLLKQLGHPQRLMLMCALLKGERAVSELERELAIRQPSLSQQLGVLRDAGLITPRRHAKSVIYAVSDARVAPIIGALQAAFAARQTGPAEAAPKGRNAVADKVATDLRAPNEAAVFARVWPRDVA